MKSLKKLTDVVPATAMTTGFGGFRTSTAVEVGGHGQNLPGGLEGGRFHGGYWGFDGIS